MLHISRITTYDLIRDGDLLSIKIGRRVSPDNRRTALDLLESQLGP
ncbi:hypothetical protein [Pseudonocardia sp.]